MAHPLALSLREGDVELRAERDARERACLDG